MANRRFFLISLLSKRDDNTRPAQGGRDFYGVQYGAGVESGGGEAREYEQCEAQGYAWLKPRSGCLGETPVLGRSSELYRLTLQCASLGLVTPEGDSRPRNERL